MLRPQRPAKRFTSGASHQRVDGIHAGNVSAMLELMKPLQIPNGDNENGQRQLLADLCRLVGVSVGASELPTTTREALGSTITTGLSPRQAETLKLLLQGQSEKQVARALGVSVHTVHVYVKAIYRRFDVSSRAELLALHMRPARN